MSSVPQATYLQGSRECKSIVVLDRYLLCTLLCFQLNTGPDCFVRESDSSVWEDSI
jgi:hypothetical protein